MEENTVMDILGVSFEDWSPTQITHVNAYYQSFAKLVMKVRGT